MVSESPLSKYNSLGMDKIGQGGCYKPASSTVTVEWVRRQSKSEICDRWGTQIAYTAVPWIWFTYSGYCTKCTQPASSSWLSLRSPLTSGNGHKPPWPQRHKTLAAASKPPSHQPPATRYSPIPSSAIAAAIRWPAISIRLIVVYSLFLSIVAAAISR